MNDKYVKLADVKRKLRYIFNAYGVNGFVKEKIKRALNDLPYSVKGDLETTRSRRRTACEAWTVGEHKHTQPAQMQ